MAFDNPEKNVATLERYAQKNTTQFTLEDAASVTGMPVIETETAIRDLMAKYDAKLKVTENGDLIYDFGPNLSRRHKKTVRERLQEWGVKLWGGFQVFYKLLTSLFLIVYFMVFVIMLLVMATRSDNNKGIGNALALIARVFISIFEWNTILGLNNRYYRNDEYGYSYQRYRQRPRILQQPQKSKDPKDEKSFVASIYDFIFGPPRVELDPLANNQEVATFLKEQKGLITTSEVQALAGWRREEAENFLTECLAYYDGEAKVTENGTLYGDFNQLIRSQNRTGEEPVVWYWDEYEPKYELTGNSLKRNAIIIGMNAFNLAAASSVMYASGLSEVAEMGGAALWFLGLIPLVYSISFFLIPALRWLRIRPLKRQQREINIRKRLMRVVFQTYDQGQAHIHEIPLSTLTKVANEQRSTEEALDDDTVKRVMEDTLQDLGGEAYVNEAAEVVYRFDRIAQELNDIDTLRDNTRPDSDLGKIIFEA